MPAILDNIHCTDFLEGERRNSLASVVAGTLFFTGWWIIIDVAAANHPSSEFDKAYYVCGVLGTLALLMINMISNGQLRGDSYTDGCAGPGFARTWLFIGFVLGFGSLIGSGWIFFADHKNVWPGIQLFIHNLFIFISGLVYKFGRSEDLWG